MALAGYRIEIERPKDGDITTRDRKSRISTAIVSSAIVLATPIILIGLLGSLVDFGITGSIVGFIAGGLLISIIAPMRMIVLNPEWSGYVTQNIFRQGTMILYGPGAHAAHWWEQRNASGNISLMVKPRTFKVGVTTGSGRVIFEGEYEYAVDLPLMDKTIGVTEELVERGITAFIDNFLTVQSADKNSKNVRSKEALERIGESLQKELMDSDGTLAAIRKQYGYKTVAIVIDNVTLPDDVQKTRNAIDEADALFEVVAKLHGMSKEDLATATKNGTVTPAQYQKMLTRAMAVSDNKTSINVNVIEGLEGNSNTAAQAATLFNSLSNGGKK